VRHVRDQVRVSAQDDASGVEWIVEAFGCQPEALRSESSLRSLFERAVRELSLRPLAPASFHLFPPPGGITGVLVLTESHLTCHTFPERGYAALNLYCCRPRQTWDFALQCREFLGAERTQVIEVRRGGLPRDAG
jgi:S-adenosylmethionine decarboxylase